MWNIRLKKITVWETEFLINQENCFFLIHRLIQKKNEYYKGRFTKQADTVHHTLCNQLALCRGCWQCTLFGLSASCHLLLWTWEPLSSLLSWGAADVSKEWDFSEYCEIVCVLHRGIPYSGFIRSLRWHLPLYPPPLCFYAHQRNLSASQSATKQVEISPSKHHQK